MPQATSAFDPRTIGEKVILGFDYTKLLSSGESVVSAVWSLTLQQGTDTASPLSSRISGNPNIASPIVTQLIDFSSAPGTITGPAQYLVQCQATTTTAEVLILYQHVTVAAAT